MPEVDGVGYSETTPLKLKHLSKLIGMHLAVTQAVLRKNARYHQHYRYIDLTAGKGYSPAGQPGSPLVFLEHAESNQMTFPYYADFLETNPRNVEALETAVNTEKTRRGWQCRHVRVHTGQYQEIIPAILPTSVDANELGLAFVDPSGDLPDFETLHYIAEKRPRMGCGCAGMCDERGERWRLPVLNGLNPPGIPSPVARRSAPDVSIAMPSAWRAVYRPWVTPTTPMASD